jgi:hypothetical protein
MANTFSANQETDPSSVVGRFRVVGGVLTMTDGNGDVGVGLEYLSMASVTPRTAVTGGFGYSINSSTNGNVSIRSAASGDTFNFMGFGY